MIREFEIQDKDNLTEIIRKGNIIEESDIISIIENEDKKLFVYDQSGIKGFGYFKLSDKETKRCEINLYVEPESRRNGIGTALYNEINKYIEVIKPNILVTEFRVNTDNPTSFYKKLGFKKWYGNYDMHYNGTYQSDVDLEFVPYEDVYFQKYAKLVQESFYELRKENDIHPYLIPISEKNRSIMLNKKEFTYVLFDKKEIIASVQEKNGYLDGIMVSEKYRGKGYGRKATQFAINKVLSNGNNLIHLSVVEWNTKAVALYKSVGFEIVQATHVYRQFCDW